MSSFALVLSDKRYYLCFMEVIINMNLLEDTAPYINSRLDEMPTDIERKMLLSYQLNKFPYCAPSVWRGLIAKGYIEMRRFNEIWLTKKGEQYK